MSEPGFTIVPARYARGQMAVHCESDGSGYKTRAMRLCAALNGRWVNREKAYLMSPQKAERLKALFAADKDADLAHVNGRLDWTL